MEWGSSLINDHPPPPHTHTYTLTFHIVIVKERKKKQDSIRVLKSGVKGKEGPWQGSEEKVPTVCEESLFSQAADES